MPSNIASPAPSAAVDRLTFASEAVRGAEQAFTVGNSFKCVCFADDAD